MATLTIVDRGSAGDLNFRVVDVTLENPYAAGGVALTPRQLGFGLNGVIYGVFGSMNPAGRLVGWDYAAGKLKVFDGSGAADAVMHEVGAIDLSAVTIRLLVFGKGHG